LEVLIRMEILFGKKIISVRSRERVEGCQKA
jgi:hypothetical protein